jgi:nickel-type superoxide dismutase maturation protease
MNDLLRSKHVGHLLVSGASPYTRPSRHRSAATPSKFGAILTSCGAALRLRLARYEVVEDSMLPVLQPGDWVLGIRDPASVDIGDIVVIDHPQRPGFRLVKRVVDRDAGGLVLAGDNPGPSVDSRHFGPVPPGEVMARLVLAYHPRPLRPL